MDVFRYLVQPEHWEELPPRWEQVFGREAPLGVEVGFGNGEFLSEMAKKHADWNWVGFETSLTCVVKTGRKLWLNRAENVRLALLDGKFGLRELFPDASVSQVLVNFPCPWPKARHTGRRLVDRAFAQILGAVLKKEGEFHLVTDALWYAEEAAQHLAAAGLAVAGPVPLSGGPGTRYERKWRARGLTIWKVLARNAEPRTVQRIAEGTMPHAKVPKNFDREKIARLTGRKAIWKDGAVVLNGIFFSDQTETALVRVFATDQGFTQQFFLVISRTTDGMLVQLDGATKPFRTPAVKRAVAIVAEELCQ